MGAAVNNIDDEEQTYYVYTVAQHLDHTALQALFMLRVKIPAAIKPTCEIEE